MAQGVKKIHPPAAGGWETGPRGVLKILAFLADISFSDCISHARGYEGEDRGKT
jgi:hypothetical protein